MIRFMQKHGRPAVVSDCLEKTDAPWRAVPANGVPRRLAFVGRSGRPARGRCPKGRDRRFRPCCPCIGENRKTPILVRRRP